MKRNYTTKIINCLLIAILLNLIDVTSLNSSNVSQAQTRQTRQTEADKLRSLAIKYYENNQIQQALSTLQKELKLHRQKRDSLKEISTLNFIAIVYDKQGKYPQAMEYLQVALTTLQKANITTEIKPSIEREILVGMGIVYANLGKYDQSLEIARKIKLINTNQIYSLGSEKVQPNNTSSLTQSASNLKADADTLYGIAVLQYQRGKVKEALGTAEAVLKMRVTAQDKVGEREVSIFINTLRQQLKSRI